MHGLAVFEAKLEFLFLIMLSAHKLAYEYPSWPNRPNAICSFSFPTPRG